MTETLVKKIIQVNDDPIVDWTVDPQFDFQREVEALEMLQVLGDELHAARKHVEHCMRYLTGAVKAARAVQEDGTRTSKEAIIRESGLARQTVYDILDED